MRSARQEASEPAPGRRGEIGSDPDHIVVAEIEAGLLEARRLVVGKFVLTTGEIDAGANHAPAFCVNRVA